MKKILLLIILAFTITAKAQVNTFSFTINGTAPTGFTTALNIAAQKWSNYLQINVPIKVNVFIVNASFLPFSAITFANGRKNFTNAPYPNILYTTPLANQLAGVVTNAGEYDMDIYFNLYTSYYFGTGKPPASQTDFISTAMHEIGHGLGFYSDGFVDNSGNGSFGNIPSSTFPIATSFPWRGQDSVPGIFDKYMVKTSGNHLTTCAPQNSTALGDSLKNGALYFSGPLYANASHSNTPVRLAGGAGTFTIGVDLLHIHQSYANTIMSYYWGPGDTVRIPAPWELGILKEIGWNLKPVGLKEINASSSFVTAYPNPANTNATIGGQNINNVKVFNAIGELVITKENSLKAEEVAIETEKLNEGIYFLKVSFNNSVQSATKKIIVKH
ncbi:MAG: T9SS type A sorting domain-containing protein [Bacteroidetes bacterium]|nr:T9SS type A sorting domain-containing protein [Bacteroidota bacterium]